MQDCTFISNYEVYSNKRNISQKSRFPFGKFAHLLVMTNYIFLYIFIYLYLQHYKGKRGRRRQGVSR